MKKFENKSQLCSRKQFFKKSLWGLAGVFGELLGDSFEKIERVFPNIIRPPGAISEESFLKNCTRCDRCIKACPFFAIRKYYGQAVFSEETPSLILKYNYCRMCDGFPCISSCPTGALVSPPNGERIVIGKATIECKFCLRKKGEHCTICVDFCSKKFNALEFTQPDLPPSLVSERCTGCGECEYHCPAKPESAISITAI